MWAAGKQKPLQIIISWKKTFTLQASWGQHWYLGFMLALGLDKEVSVQRLMNWMKRALWDRCPHRDCNRLHHSHSKIWNNSVDIIHFSDNICISNEHTALIRLVQICLCSSDPAITTSINVGLSVINWVMFEPATQHKIYIFSSWFMTLIL